MDDIFKTLNEDEQLYQWDLGRRLVVLHDTCCEVHFYNKLKMDALRCEVYEEDDIRYVNIPNILLQEPRFITACAYVVNADRSITSTSQSFGVRPRPKPSSYVYTETEVLTWQTLDKRIKELEDNHSELAQLEVLIEADMLPAVHDANGAILTDENGNIILRY